jgi:hypothetical protein
MNTLRGLAKAFGERMHRSAAMTIRFVFIGILVVGGFFPGIVL